MARTYLRPEKEKVSFSRFIIPGKHMIQSIIMHCLLQSLFTYIHFAYSIHCLRVYTLPFLKEKPRQVTLSGLRKESVRDLLL